MRKKKHTNIRESEVEEALVSNLVYLKKLLSLTYDLRLIARQLRLKSGDKKLDLLIAHGTELCLLELKVTKFFSEHIKQINEYREELYNLQSNGELFKAEIHSFLLVTSYNRKDKDLCESHQITIIKYEPLDVLKDYFQNLYSVAPFLRIKPNDYGVYNIGLINRVLENLSKGVLTQNKLAEVT